jgi:hypothetical protein
MTTEFSWEEWYHSTYVDLIEEEAEEAVEFFGVDSDTVERWVFDSACDFICCR